MELTYTLNSFDPAYAHDIDYTGDGIMFSYYEPDFMEEVKVWNAGETPDDVIISLTDSRIALYVVYLEDDESEDCFFCVNRQAGRDMLTWVGQKAYRYEGVELLAYIQRVLLTLAYAPSDTGGVALDDLSCAERQLMYEAYQFITA